MQKFVCAVASIASVALGGNYGGGYGPAYEVYEHRPMLDREFDRYGNPTDIKQGAVEYFGTDGRSYGVGESVDKTTYGPNGVVTSTEVSFSSSTNGGMAAPSFKGLGGNNAGSAEDILSDIFAESFGNSMGSGFGGLGSLGGGFSGIEKMHEQNMSSLGRIGGFGEESRRPARYTGISSVGYGSSRPAGYGGYERNEYRPRPYGGVYSAEPKRPSYPSYSRSYAAAPTRQEPARSYESYTSRRAPQRTYGGYEEMRRPYGGYRNSYSSRNYAKPTYQGYRAPQQQRSYYSSNDW